MAWTSGRTGGDIAIGFDGTAGQDLPAPGEFPAGAAPRRVVAWMQYDGLQDAILLDCGIDGDRTRFLFIAGGDASLAVVLGSGQTINTGPGVLADGLWHLLEARYDGTTLELLIDGASVVSAAWTLATDVSQASIGEVVGGGDPGTFAVQDWQVWPTGGP